MGELVKVGTVSEIPPGTCRHVEVAGRDVAVFNVEGTIYAMAESVRIRAARSVRASWREPSSPVRGTVLSSM